MKLNIDTFITYIHHNLKHNQNKKAQQKSHAYFMSCNVQENTSRQSHVHISCPTLLSWDWDGFEHTITIQPVSSTPRIISFTVYDVCNKLRYILAWWSCSFVCTSHYRIITVMQTFESLGHINTGTFCRVKSILSIIFHSIYRAFMNDCNDSYPPSYYNHHHRQIGKINH